MNWFLVALLLFLSGCSGLPVSMRNNTYSNIHLSVVSTNIAAYKNSHLRWGGTVISVDNQKESSQIQLLFYPINNYGRPLTNRKTEGRFALTSHLFLDPAIYKEGTEITVTGVLSGEVKQQIGQKTLTLPLLTIEHIHIWPEQQQVNERFYGYPLGSPYYYPYRRYYPYYY